MLKIQLRSKQAPLLALVACLTLQIGAPQNVAAQLANNSLIPQAENKARVERKTRGIPAELIDAGDYYFRADGSKVTMLRKKDVFVVKADPSKRQRAMQRFKARYGDRVKQITKHRLGSANVIRLDNRTTTKAAKKQPFDIQPQMLETLDNSVSELLPVFAGVRGQGDLLPLPKITVKIGEGVNAQTVLGRLKNKYSLTIDRKLRLSGTIYSLKLTNTNISQSQQFATVRSLMNEAGVVWAEPQFYSKPYKTAFNPTNNPLYDKQWHLRNAGLGGSRCDTDCDANNAWDIDITNNTATGGGGVGAIAGEGMVIAIIDDGVQLDHPDLSIWNNPAEDGSNGCNDGDATDTVDNDNNGYVDDCQGWDFVNDPNTSLQNSVLDGAGTCVGNDDGDIGQDNNPNPQAFTDCFTIEGDPIEQDHHGTAVAGLAAAIGDNTNGVAGTAFRAQVLPVRLVSDFDIDVGNSFCNKAAEAIEYAGRYADVINNSWGTDDDCETLRAAIKAASSGTVMDGMANVSKRPNLGSPILFASGNDASGWIKVTVPVNAGTRAYEWRYIRGAFTEVSDNNDSSIWLDEITYPDGITTESFESGLDDFENEWLYNSLECDEECVPEDEPFVEFMPIWQIDSSRARFGTSSAQLNPIPDGVFNESGLFCGYSYLNVQRNEPQSGEISFWLWISIDTDKVEFLVDGVEKFSFGDVPARAIVNDDVGFPALLSGVISGPSAPYPGVIAVGASTSGDLSGVSSAGLVNEERVYYSQFGPELDVVAPSSDQHLGIVTTDRTGSDGYNQNEDIGGTTAADPDYTDDFGGTSASTPMVAGIAAAMIAVNPNLSAADIKQKLHETADKIGRDPFVSATNGTRNDFVGYGRVNMFNAVASADPDAIVGNPATSACSPEGSYSFENDLVLPGFLPEPTQFCPARGPIPDNELCVPIRAVNGNIAFICL